MAVYAPVITTDSEAAVTAAGVGMSYDELINSFSQYNFLMEYVFYQSQSFGQIAEPMSWMNYDSNGVRYSSVTVPAPDPYQAAPTIFLDVRREKVWVNGRSQLTFDLLPLSNIMLSVYASKNYIADYLALKNRALIGK